MLNEHETQLAMEHFFKDCLNFWRRNTNDERVAFEKALNDTRGITTDPFSPCGRNWTQRRKRNLFVIECKIWD